MLDLFLMRDEPSILFVLDGAGYRVVSGAHASQGFNQSERAVFVLSLVALILMGG